ncbi:hypothetical protein T439DRAFT_328639 [Meredithblackwellia eburnea MCA 4105]
MPVYSEKKCQFCSLEFKKREHCIRHERTHTNEQPFNCPECSKPFGRQDSLARHLKTHQIGSPLGSMGLVLERDSPRTSTTASLPSPRGPPVEDHPPPPPPPPIHSSPPPGWASTLQLDGILGEGASTVDHENGAPSGQHLDELPSSVNGTTLSEFNPFQGDSLFECLFDNTLPFSNLWPLIPAETGLQEVDWTIPLPQAPIPSLLDRAVAIPTGGEPSPANSDSLLQDGAAIRETRSYITDLGTSLDAARTTSISSEFLNTCIVLFWERFAPSLPILHRPTFDARQCIPPLLLNIIALGSLFSETRTSHAKGEHLWILAHKAVASAWDKLILYQGPHDQTQGVQLVLTALLGQIFASLSNNKYLRATARTFHSLGFRWADESAMNLTQKPLDLSAANTPAEIDVAWRKWAAREVQLRAILGHYILDGQISSFDHMPPTIRHTLNQACPGASDQAFAAHSADDWITLMRARPDQLDPQPTFSELYLNLFQKNSPTVTFDPSNDSFLTTYTMLEGISSLASELQLAGTRGAVGLPSRAEVLSALRALYRKLSSECIQAQPWHRQLLIRWHAVNITTLVPLPAILQRLEHDPASQARMLSTSAPTFDPSLWASTRDARRALLHAVAICSLAESCSVGAASAIHLPGCIFLGAMTMAAYTLGKPASFTAPAYELTDSDAWVDSSDATPPNEDLIRISDTTRFLLEGGSATINRRPLHGNLQLYPYISLLRRLSHNFAFANSLADEVAKWME